MPCVDLEQRIADSILVWLRKELFSAPSSDESGHVLDKEVELALSSVMATALVDDSVAGRANDESWLKYWCFSSGVLSHAEWMHFLLDRELWHGKLLKLHTT